MKIDDEIGAMERQTQLQRKELAKSVLNLRQMAILRSKAALLSNGSMITSIAVGFFLGKARLSIAPSLTALVSRIWSLNKVLAPWFKTKNATVIKTAKID